MECFEENSLYKKLIPDGQTRKRLLPELLEYDLEQSFNTCEMYADSQAVYATSWHFESADRGSIGVCT